MAAAEGSVHPRCSLECTAAAVLCAAAGTPALRHHFFSATAAGPRRRRTTSAAWRHWSYGFEPAFRSHLLRHVRSIPVEVETWQDESWAQGAAALVLATPFDAGAAGDQGRLIRARLVEQAGRS